MSAVVVRTRARRDLLDTASYLTEQGGAVLAERFLQAAYDTFAGLARMPGKGAGCSFRDPRLENLRHCQVRGFANWLIFYEITAGGIDIVHVIHGARDICKLLEN